MIHRTIHRASLLLLGGLLGCPHQAGLVPLQALPDSDTGTEKLDARAAVELQVQPSQGWDLVLDLHLHAREGVRPLVDLSRTMWRADGLRWTPCDLPADEDPDSLRLRLYEEEAIHLVLRCEQIQRPASRLELRVPVSGAGGRGYLEFMFNGVDNADDRSAWELD
jgi:hypothetical protein